MLPASDRRSLHWLAWAAAVLLILWWTLLPFRQDLSADALRRALAEVQWLPFVERGRFPLWSDLLANFVLFVPFGFAGWRCLERRASRLAVVLVVGGVLSLGVEAVQLSLPARRTSVSDFSMDLVGILAGIGLGKAWERGVRGVVERWLRDLRHGASANLCAALFAGCLLLWALLPGSAPEAGLWAQVQGFSSSFRRFPGFARWTAASLHLFLFGGILALLIAPSVPGAARRRLPFGAAATVLLGLLLEVTQLAVPGREPQIFQALALGAGGVAGAGASLLRPATRVVLVAIAAGAGLFSRPVPDTWPAATRAVLVAGGILALLSALAAGGAQPHGNAESGPRR